MIRGFACMCLLAHALLTSPKAIELTVFIEGNDLPQSSAAVKACDLKTGQTLSADVQGSYAQLQLKKDTEYLISLSSLPAGFMPCDEVFIDTYGSSLQMEAVIEVVPFDVRIYQCGVSRDDILEGGTLQLLSQQDQVLFEWHPQKDGRVISEDGEAMDFHAGETFVLHQTEAADGNSMIEDLIMIIPEFRTSKDETFAYRFYPSIMQKDDIQPAAARYEPAVYTAAITEPVILPEPEKKEVILPEEEKEAPVQSPPLVVSVFHQPEEKAENTAAQAEISHPGFYVSFTDEHGRALKDAQFCVLNQEGSEVDSWTADGQLHLVQNEGITPGTYIIRQKTAAPGYVKMQVDLEHTVSENDTGSLPVINIANRRVQTAAEVPAEKKARKTAHYLVYAAGGTAAVCAGLAAFMFKKKKA